MHQRVDTWEKMCGEAMGKIDIGKKKQKCKSAGVWAVGIWFYLRQNMFLSQMPSILQDVAFSPSL